MDRNILVRIVRDDSKEFRIGTNQDWQLLKDGSGLDGFGEFENQINFIENASFDGGIFTGSHISKTDRTISAGCVRMDQNDTQRAAALAFFRAKANYKIYVTYAGQTRWAEGKLYKFKAPNTHMGQMQKLAVTFLFADPYWKSVDDFGKDIAAIKPMIGFPYMVNGSGGRGPKGLTAGVFTFDKVVTLSNKGDVETRCRIVIHASGKVINPSVIINDEYVRIIDEMQSGDEIEVNFEALPPTVKKNGENFIGHADRTSAFDSMILNVGENEIQYDADDGDLNMSVSVYYYQLYGAI